MERMKFTSLIFICLLFGQCSKGKGGAEGKPDDSFLSIEAIDKEQIADKEQQTLLVPVEGNVAYNVVSGAAWASVPHSVKAGESFSIALEENPDSEIRQTTVTLSAENIVPIEISVRQGGVAPFALMSPSVVEISDNLTFVIKVETNIEYDLTVSDWLTEVPLTNRALVRTDEYSYKASSTQSARSGEIKLVGKGEDNNITEKITVNQGMDYGVAPKFAVISDVHIRTIASDTETTDSQGKLERTLEYLLTKNPEAIFIVGDITDNGWLEEHNRLKGILASKVPENIPVYVTTGNHDLYGGRGSNFTTAFGINPNQYFEFKGHPFIIVGMNSSSSPYYDNTAKDFLTEKLAEAAASYPDKPIFVFYHVPAQNTVYGSAATAAQGGGWGSNVLSSVIEQYPQAIAFSGHSHFPLGDERSIHQDKFTSINLGSVTYTEFENNGFVGGIHPPRRWEVTEGVIVEPVDNPVLKAQGKYYKDYRISRYDTYRGEEIKEPWLITAPYDGTAFPYKGRNGATHSFVSGASVTTSDIGPASVNIEWSQATAANSRDKVHHYEVQAIKTENGTVAQTLKIYSQFYLNSEIPAILNHKVEGLEFNTSYRIEIRAVDSWYVNKSEPIVSQDFVTENYTPDPSTTIPAADLFDVAFTNIAAQDYSPFGHTVAEGTNVITYSFNPTLQQYMATYTSNNQSMHRLDYTGKTDFIEKYRTKFTIEAFYKNTSNDNVTPVSGQQSGGLGIEQASNGATRLWLHTNGSYKQAGATVTNTTDYYHMVFTYDGTKAIAYTNGVKVAEQAVSGSVTLPSSGAHWFCIGGDANVNSDAQFSMPGDIVFTRFYSEPITQDQVYKLYEQIDSRKNLTKVTGLKNALENTIPAQLSGAVGAQRTQLENLQKQGWKLMKNLGTTDQDIQSFLSELNNI